MRGRLTKNADIDLGLAVSGATLGPGETRSREDLAAFCGCLGRPLNTSNNAHCENSEISFNSVTTRLYGK
jgi:hypothetical protein